MEALCHRATVNLLRKSDYCVQRVIFRGAYCCVYVWSALSSEWLRSDVEGSLYVVEWVKRHLYKLRRQTGQRSQNPREISVDGIVRNETGIPHGPEVSDALTKPQLSPESQFRLIVVNQKTTVNLVDDITDDWDVSTAEEFVFYRRPIGQSKFKVVGIWIASSSERNELADLIRSVQSNNFIDVDEGARQGQEILDIINGKSARATLSLKRETNPAFPANDSLSSDSSFFQNHARSFARGPLENHFAGGATGKTELDCLVDELLCDENLGSCRDRRAAFLQLVEEPEFRAQLAKTIREHSQY